MDVCHDKTHKLSKFATEEDVISHMPDNVITNVLDCLPIKDSVKTGILSKKWRLKWTLLTQIVFDNNFFENFLGPGKEKKYNWRDIIGRLLLHLNGPITKFVLYIPRVNKVLGYEDMYHWVLFLSRKGCKELTFSHMDSMAGFFAFKLPTSLFSCIELQHLKLQYGGLHLLPSFSGFPSLCSLDLYFVTFEICNLAEFVARCPLLEILIISDSEPIRERELNQIAKLVNLKTLYLSGSLSASISELSLPPKLQELTLDFTSLAEVGAIKVPTAFLCLKTLVLSGIDLNSEMMVMFVFKMICGSPNLLTLKIVGKYWNDVTLPALLSSSYFVCSPMEQLQLRTVVFDRVRGSENEVYLIKSLLACSPLLSKINIGLNASSMVGGSDGKFMFACKLLKLYRASPIVDINLY